MIQYVLSHLDTSSVPGLTVFIDIVFPILFSISVKAMNIHLVCRQAIVKVTWLKNILCGFMSIEYIAVILKRLTTM